MTVVEAESTQTFEMGAAPQTDDRVDGSALPFRARLTLSNLGASVEQVLLTDHAAKLASHDRYALLAPVERSDGRVFRSLAVEKINVDGMDVVLADKRWHCSGVEEYRSADGETGHRAEFRIDVHKNDLPFLQISRIFQLPHQPVGSGRHDLFSTLALKNVTKEPYKVVVTSRGGIGNTRASLYTDDRFIDVGVASNMGHVIGSRTADLAVVEKKSISLFTWSREKPDQRFSWAATANTYFTCTIAPVAADGKGAASYIHEVAAVDADGDSSTSDDVTLRFTSTLVELPPEGEVHYPAAIFLGEKDGQAFRSIPEYKDRNYYYQIEQGFGWCTFTFLVELMIWLLNGLHFVVRDFGVAIIILVLIVRTMLHPITKKGQVNMVRMQHKMAEMGPKIEEIKKKFANDKARLNQEMMKLNINPAGQLMSCLPMFIQMPIWVALYLSLSNNILMRHEPFLFTWIEDLTAQDALIKFSAPFHVPIFGWELTSFNLLPLLVALFMYIQQKTQPKPKPNPNMTDQQRQQQETMQRMMPIMSIMMMLIFYKMPSGLNLYIMFSSLFGWLEQARIRKHIREHEDAGTLHNPPPKKPKPEFTNGPPKSKLSWLERLQKAAEEAQKAQRTQRTKRNRS